MANFEGGPQEKHSFNSEELGELNKEEIKRLRYFFGTLNK